MNDADLFELPIEEIHRMNENLLGMAASVDSPEAERVYERRIEAQKLLKKNERVGLTKNERDRLQELFASDEYTREIGEVVGQFL